MLVSFMNEQDQTSSNIMMTVKNNQIKV